MLLKTNELTKEYKRSGKSFSAVEKVSLTVNDGDFILITGRSGSGKSTLLNLLVGLIRPTRGSVLFEEKSLFDGKDEELSLLRNKRIGYIPQGQSLLPNLTALDNVLLPFRIYKVKGEPEKRAGELLEKMGIAHLTSSFPEELSGGELRRVTIARALINSPSLLVADEPTGDLDPQTSGEVMKLFEEVAKSGIAVVLVTHDPDVLRFGNRHLCMYGGRLTTPID